MTRNEQERLAASCADAMFGYASAATEAYWAVARESLALWSGLADSWTLPERREASSWYRPEGNPRSSLLPGLSGSWRQEGAWPMGAAPGLDFLTKVFGGSYKNPFELPFSNPLAFAMRAFPTPMAMWTGWAPWQAPPAAWPMAFAMITSGVPHTVAWPAARANAAALDVATTIGEQINVVFSSYRSDGGHAAVVRTPPSAFGRPAATWMPTQYGAWWQLPWGWTA